MTRFELWTLGTDTIFAIGRDQGNQRGTLIKAWQFRQIPSFRQQRPSFNPGKGMK
jgi:hypothetical protein